MNLYYSPGACSLADHIALLESGLSFEAVKVDLKEKKTEDGRDYTAINPKGYVPALELDDGAILTENIAILSYIADTSGKLMPAEGLARCRVLEAMAFISTEIHKSHKPFFSPDARDADKAAAKDMLLKRYAILEKQLGDGPYLFGESVTAADCYLAVMLFWGKTKVGLDLPPALSAYYDRMTERPAVRQAMTDEGLG
ncbi:MAG: glutathione binding-like protein [Sphingobium sp.]